MDSKMKITYYVVAATVSRIELTGGDSIYIFPQVKTGILSLKIYKSGCCQQFHFTISKKHFQTNIVFTTRKMMIQILKFLPKMMTAEKVTSIDQTVCFKYVFKLQDDIF